ncbi:MAG: hypothetical protein EHM59_06075 [Betaproteobacteria bacterium]|nr:MAG: hypothetical protein EHM59_06075 [Betaproteobacteria bacterium]
MGQALVQLAILLENAGGCGLNVICANAQQISHSGLRKLLSVDAKGRSDTPVVDENFPFASTIRALDRAQSPQAFAL